MIYAKREHMKWTLKRTICGRFFFSSRQNAKQPYANVHTIHFFLSLYSCSKRNTKNDHKESSVTRARLTIKFKMSPCLIVFVLVRKYLKFVFWSVFEYLHRKKSSTLIQLVTDAQQCKLTVHNIALIIFNNNYLKCINAKRLTSRLFICVSVSS